MSDQELHTEGPTEGQSAPAGGVDPARDAAREAQGEAPAGEAPAPAAPAGEAPAETTGDDTPETPQDPAEQPADTETPNDGAPSMDTSGSSPEFTPDNGEEIAQ